MFGMTEKYDVAALTLEVEGLRWGGGCMEASNLWNWSCEKANTGIEDRELSTWFKPYEAWLETFNSVISIWLMELLFYLFWGYPGGYLCFL